MKTYEMHAQVAVNECKIKLQEDLPSTCRGTVTFSDFVLKCRRFYDLPREFHHGQAPLGNPLLEGSGAIAIKILARHCETLQS